MNETLFLIMLGVVSSMLFQFLYSMLIEAIYALREHDKPLDRFIQREKKKHSRDVIQEISLQVVQTLEENYHVTIEDTSNKEEVK